MRRDHHYYKYREWARAGLYNSGNSIDWIFPGFYRILRSIPRVKSEGITSNIYHYYPDVFEIKNGVAYDADSLSRLPGWHPCHVCGIFCDGQDSCSKCFDERLTGPSLAPLYELSLVASIQSNNASHDETIAGKIQNRSGPPQDYSKAKKTSKSNSKSNSKSARCSRRRRLNKKKG